MLAICISIIAVSISLITLLVIYIKQTDNYHNETKAIAANNLAYTEQELYAIERLINNKGKRLTANELGCSAITLISLRKKQYKVKTGELTNKEHLPILNIIKQKDNDTTRYGIK